MSDKEQSFDGRSKSTSPIRNNRKRAFHQISDDDNDNNYNNKNHRRKRHKSHKHKQDSYANYRGHSSTKSANKNKHDSSTTSDNKNRHKGPNSSDITSKSNISPKSNPTTSQSSSNSVPESSQKKLKSKKKKKKKKKLLPQLSEFIMAQNTEPSDDSKPKERANIVGKTPLDYSKWEDLDFESDEDDCHPNIEIGTWRRLKERMRREKGIKKKEPYLVDKWNVTTTNKNYAIDPTKPPKTTQEQEQKQENTNETNTSNTPPPKDNTKENKPITNDNNYNTN
eukprot:255283_1